MKSVRQKWNFWRGGPFCESILENPEGMGGQKKNPFGRGYGYFLEMHIIKTNNFSV